VSVETVAGLFLLAMPIAFNVAFGLLAARFDYPDILRRPDAEVLSRFSAYVVWSLWLFGTGVALVT
jgi:hypothetical protein